MFRALIAAAALLVLVQLPTAAQETPVPQQTPPDQSPTPAPPATAEELSDVALAKLAAWRTSAAAALLDAHRDQFGQTPAYRTALAMQRAESGAIAEAVPLLQAAAAELPSDPAPEYLRGELYYWQKRLGDANAAWQSAANRATARTTANPDDGRAHYYRGAALIRLRRTADARAALTLAQQKGFDATLVGFQNGLAHVTDGKWQPAIQALDPVIQADPLFAPAYFYRGLAWSKLGRKDNMVNDLDQFVKLAPGSPDAATARALMSGFSR